MKKTLIFILLVVGMMAQKVGALQMPVAGRSPYTGSLKELLATLSTSPVVHIPLKDCDTFFTVCTLSAHKYEEHHPDDDEHENREFCEIEEDEEDTEEGGDDEDKKDDDFPLK